MDGVWNDPLAHDDGAQPLSPVLVKRGAGGEGSLCTIRIRREAKRFSNQRAEKRRTAHQGPATIHFRGAKYSARVINTSPGGAMVECDIVPLIGEPLAIQFPSRSPDQCVARWVRDGRVGIEFGSHDLLVAHSQKDEFVYGIGEAIGDVIEEAEDEEAEEPAAAARQREPRQAVIRTAKLRAGNKVLQVRLCNISPGGVMLESDQYLAPGSEVRLEMGGGILATAKVRWNNGKRVGLRFDDLLDLKCLSPTSVTYTPTVLKPRYLDSEFDPHSPWAARFDRLTPEDLAGDGK